jgi:hypothetical protein
MLASLRAGKKHPLAFEKANQRERAVFQRPARDFQQGFLTATKARERRKGEEKGKNRASIFYSAID